MVTHRHIVLVDIDHTLSAAWPRDGMIGTTSWDDYHSASHADEPIHDVVALINTLSRQEWYVVGLTARPEKWRTLTMGWLVKHSVAMDEILMRPTTGFAPAPEIKIQLVKERFGADAKDQIAFLLEDRADVVAAFQEFGITCLQVHGRRS